MTTTRERLVAVVVTVALVLVLVGVSLVVRHQRRPVPVVVDPACPALLRGTSSATQDFADVIYWGGRQLVASDGAATAGDRVGAVTCSIVGMDNPDGWRVTGDRWPDGTAVVLSTGTALYSAAGRARGAVVARTSEGDVLYCPASEALEPGC